jgi:hypothetical protein
LQQVRAARDASLADHLHLATLVLEREAAEPSVDRQPAERGVVERGEAL